MYEETRISYKFMGDKPCLYQCHRAGDGMKEAYGRAGSFVYDCFQPYKILFLHVFVLFQNIKQECIFEPNKRWPLYNKRKTIIQFLRQMILMCMNCLTI